MAIVFGSARLMGFVVAQRSGQLQRSAISRGEGNNPAARSQSRAIVRSDNFPCSSATTESISPAQSRQMADHRDAGTELTDTSTR